MVLLVYRLGGQLGICRLLSKHNRHRPSSVHRWLSSHCYFRTCAHPPTVAPAIMQWHTAGNAVYLPEAFLSSSLPSFFRARQSDGMRDSSEQTFCSSRTSGSKIIRLRIFLPFSGTASGTKCMITLRLHLCRPLTPQWLEMERNMQVILRCRLSARLL